MNKLIYILSIISFSFLQCDSPESDTPLEECPNARNYQMKDFSNLAGCTWMLVSGDQAYEVVNIADYFDSYEEDIIVVVELKIREDLASICQAGMITEIVCKQ